MRNKRLHPTRFFLHRYFYLGVAMLAVFFLVLPMQALVRLPQSLDRWNQSVLGSGGTLADLAPEIRSFLSGSLLYSLLGLEGLHPVRRYRLSFCHDPVPSPFFPA